MSDVHLRILRDAATSRARQLRVNHAEPGETAADSDARRARLEGLATRARQRLSTASARRREPSGGPEPRISIP
jgi:hypothetical protein